MTAVYVGLYVVLFAATYNGLVAVRLRWKAMVEHPEECRPDQHERWVAAALVLPVLLVALAGYVVWSWIGGAYDLFGSVVVLTVAVGVPGSAVLAQVIRALAQYRAVPAHD